MVKRNIKKIIVAATICACVASPLLSAKTFFMINGDQITGDIIRQNNNSITLQTSYAGKIQISKAHIVTGKKSPAASKTKPPTVVEPLVSVLDPNMVTSKKADGANRDNKFSGSINFAMKMENGNNEKNEVDTDFSLTYRDANHRYRIHGELEYDLRDGDNIKRDWQIIPTYDYFISDKLYASMMYAAKQEKYAGLNLRQTMGPSIGYQFFDGKPVKLMSALGLYFVDEDFDSKDDNNYFGPGWHLDYQHDLFKGKVQFYHRHHTLMSFEHIDKFLWHSWTGLKMPIIGGIIGSAEFELDYDSQPALEAETIDTTLRLKIGYEW